MHNSHAFLVFYAVNVTDTLHKIYDVIRKSRAMVSCVFGCFDVINPEFGHFLKGYISVLPGRTMCNFLLGGTRRTHFRTV